jgi:hypothetical protein
MRAISVHAECAVLDAAGGDQLAHHVIGQIRRDGEADARARARWRDDRGIDADQFATQVDQCAAGVARIDRRVGLDEVLDAAPPDGATAEAGDDTRTRTLADAERITDRDDEVAHAQLAHIGDGQRREIFRSDLDHGNVGFRIGADQVRLERAPVMQRDRDVVGSFDDVVVRHDIALCRVDDDARSQRLLDALARQVLHAEELAEERIIRERVAHAHACLRTDVDDRRHDALEHRRQ